MCTQPGLTSRLACEHYRQMPADTQVQLASLTRCSVSVTDARARL